MRTIGWLWRSECRGKEDRGVAGDKDLYLLS